jgi:hypothetical protein
MLKPVASCGLTGDEPAVDQQLQGVGDGAAGETEVLLDDGGCGGVRRPLAQRLDEVDGVCAVQVVGARLLTVVKSMCSAAEPALAQRGQPVDVRPALTRRVVQGQEAFAN